MWSKEGVNHGGDRRRISVFLASLAILGVLAAQETRGRGGGDGEATNRITVQIHEAPGPGQSQYYIFYVGKVDTRNQTRTVFSIPRDAEGVSVYPDENRTWIDLELDETREAKRATVVTNGSGYEFRYYILRSPLVERDGDRVLELPLPDGQGTQRTTSVVIHWPNWIYTIPRLMPDGAELSMNPLFSDDPYRSVSYYWYVTAGEAAPEEVVVWLRPGRVAARKSRNQTTIIISLVVAIPTALMIVAFPPKRTQKTRFRVMEEAEKRRRVRKRPGP
jgi:hypothetical protein